MKVTCIKGFTNHLRAALSAALSMLRFNLLIAGREKHPPGASAHAGHPPALSCHPWTLSELQHPQLCCNLHHPVGYFQLSSPVPPLAPGPQVPFEVPCVGNPFTRWLLFTSSCLWPAGLKQIGLLCLTLAAFAVGLQQKLKPKHQTRNSKGEMETSRYLLAQGWRSFLVAEVGDAC